MWLEANIFSPCQLNCCLSRLEYVKTKKVAWCIEQPSSSLLPYYKPFEDQYRFTQTKMRLMNAHFIFTQPMPSPSQDLIRRHRAKIYHVPLGMHGAKTENLGGKLNGNPNKKFWIFSLWGHWGRDCPGSEPYWLQMPRSWSTSRPPVCQLSKGHGNTSSNRKTKLYDPSAICLIMFISLSGLHCTNYKWWSPSRWCANTETPGACQKLLLTQLFGHNVSIACRYSHCPLKCLLSGWRSGSAAIPGLSLEFCLHCHLVKLFWWCVQRNH